jgi:hypothetical protein
MTMYTGFVQLTDLPDGFLDLNSNILTEQERIYSGAITDWLQQSEWRCGRILLRYLIAGAYGVSRNSIIIHTRSDGQLIAETPAGQVHVSHSRIPGMWVGATAKAHPIGVDLVNIADFPVDVNGVDVDADAWARMEAIAKLTSRGMAWALTSACYPVDGLISTPSGDRYREASIPTLPVDVRAVLLGPAEPHWDMRTVDVISKIH